MFELPLHPKFVHLPLGLAVVLPLVLAGLLLAIRRAWLAERAWWVGAALAVLLLGGTWAATQTGETDEERVEDVVGGRLIHEHEEAAEGFLAAAAVTALVALAGAVLPARLRTPAQVVAVVGAVGALAAALRTGHLGGELVYKHGAARAWTTPATSAAEPAPQQRAHDGE
jgi:drug/metabolite transporter (DMT)-like permease